MLVFHMNVMASHLADCILPCRFANVIIGWAVGGNVWH